LEGKWAAGKVFWAAWVKEKGWAGEENRRGFCIFLNLIQTLQSKFKFNEFKFKLNNKQ